MRTIIEDFPFTTILALIGILVGLMLPSGLDILTNIDTNQITEDPAGFLTGYVIGVPLAVMVEVISGLIGELIMGVDGLVIDLIKNSRNGGFGLWKKIVIGVK